MKICLSLVPWLTMLAVVATHASVIPRVGPAETGLDAADEGREEQQPQRLENDHSLHHHHHRHEHHLHRHHGHSSGCPGCRQWKRLEQASEEELIQLRIERIKQDLLSRLGLSAPPNASVNRVVPERIPAPLQCNEDNGDDHRSHGGADGKHPASLNDEDEEELIEGHSKQIIVFSEEAAVFHRHRSTNTTRRHSLRFNLPPEVPADTVLSAELWLYKNRDSDGTNCTTNSTQSVSVYTFISSDASHLESRRTSPHMLASQEVPPHDDWFRMDFTDVVQSWIADPRTNRDLEVEHSDCVRLETGLSYRPFLTIGTRRGSARRRKRNAQQCHDGTQNCCRKHSLYINFRELGWNFIVSPLGYNANYCHGPCSVPSFENLMSTQRRHSALLQKFSRLRNNPDVLPCCSPTSLSSLSLIYNDDKGMIIRQDLDNMRVDSCGCS